MFPDVSYKIRDMERGWQRVAGAVISRRRALGMRTASALAEKMQVSSRLLGDIENARRTSYSPGTIAALEAALRWESGSVRAVLDGHEPVERPELTAREAGRALEHGDADVLEELRSISRGLAALIPAGPADGPRLGDIPSAPLDKHSASDLTQALAAKISDLEAEIARLKEQVARGARTDVAYPAATVIVEPDPAGSEHEGYDLAQRLGQSDLGAAFDRQDRAGEAPDDEGPEGGA
jgi:transcriptional regulator with XRE-family HTH domain